MLLLIVGVIALHFSAISALIFLCGAAPKEEKKNTESAAPPTAPAAPAEGQKPGESVPALKQEEKKDAPPEAKPEAKNEGEKEKNKSAKGEEKKEEKAPAGGEKKEEEDAGYESCPDMTPEQLAKIANEGGDKK